MLAFWPQSRKNIDVIVLTSLGQRVLLHGPYVIRFNTDLIEIASHKQSVMIKMAGDMHVI